MAQNSLVIPADRFEPGPFVTPFIPADRFEPGHFNRGPFNREIIQQVADAPQSEPGPYALRPLAAR